MVFPFRASSSDDPTKYTNYTKYKNKVKYKITLNMTYRHGIVTAGSGPFGVMEQLGRKFIAMIGQ